jgi:hypothetical protein
VLVRFTCVVAILLPARLPTGNADEPPATARQVIQGWKHPDAKPNSGGVGSGNDALRGETFRVPRPFEEVWQFYARKCGYHGGYPGTNHSLLVSGGNACLMMYENSTALGGGVSSAFGYREKDTFVSVSLVDRKDGVRVFVSVGAR